MTFPEWTKPAIGGAAIGALALAMVGFTWGGWMTESKANRLAAAEAQSEVLAALTPVCLEKAAMDPNAADTFAKLKAAGSYSRADILMKAGWATVPGDESPNRRLASECVTALGDKI